MEQLKNGDGQTPASDDAASPLPSISLPKGGGAIRGIGEKFDVSPVTGTGSLTVPIAGSPGRSGFGPRLNLSYDSGAGNGPFGFGWSLGLQAITRKTDKGLPRYCDGDELDVFILAGSEDLVPVLDAGGERAHTRRTVHRVTYEVYPYRPRVEGGYARIERWTAVDSGVSHWRTISRDNVTTLYGLDGESRITDPDDSRNVFSYLICRVFDAKGNVTVYSYVAEDSQGIDRSQAHEANRSDTSRGVQRYLKSIRYGNVQPYFPDWSAEGPEPALPADWHFELVLDYGDHGSDVPVPTPDRAWPVRPDPFSRYRAGFEVRTYRRCARVLLFHHFPGEEGVGRDCLVRSTDFVYSDQQSPAEPDNPIYTMLQSVTQTGYRRQGAGYLSRSMPPLEFEYSRPQLQADVQTLDRESLENVPEGFDGARFRWVDLDGEGLPGVLSDLQPGWGYKRNLSPTNLVLQPDGGERVQARFGPQELVGSLPSFSELGGAQRLLDLTGDGRLDVVVYDSPTPGFFERTDDERWEPFRQFASLPQIDWSNPNVAFVDLTGDGLADVLLTEDSLFTAWPSLGADGFAAAEQVSAPWDEERGPALVLADGTNTVFLADLSGDGLSDLVRVRNGEVCYWPNLGYGRFGARVTMDGAPRFASDEQFDGARIRLADIDGSGTADLLYIGDDAVQVCFNRSGNSWAAPQRLAVFPSTDRLSSVQVMDLLGNGTACLAWSSPLLLSPSAPLRYVDLMGGRKPHLLMRTRNNLGAETRLRYAPSTRFYLADKLAGHPWVTRLPFPVQVVERVEAFDWIGRSRFVTRYAYHHGHFDGEEREFRGFGLVEQWDTEEHRGDTDFPEAEATNWDQASWTPPMLTRTWFHTGVFAERAAVSRQYAGEYWTESALRPDDRADDRAAMQLPDTPLPSGLTPDEVREACRALKGMALRTEIYGMDGSSRAANPYSVTEHNFTVRLLQATGPNRHAVFFTHPRETLAFHYERQEDDPRVTHDVTLEVDDYGNVRRSISIGYPRRTGYPEPEPALSPTFRQMLAYDQTRLHVAATENRYTNALDDPAAMPDTHRTPARAEVLTAELTGITPASNRAGITSLFRFEELDGIWHTVWDGAHDVPYEEVPSSDIDGTGALPASPTRRIVSHTQTLYRADDLSALLPLRQLQSLALPGETYRLALTPGLIARIFGALVPAATLTEGGYTQAPDGTNWWVPSGRTYYSAGDADTAATELAEARSHFFLPRRTVDPFGAETRVSYLPYDLLPDTHVDAVGNASTAANDYRVLQPYLSTDANGNRTQVAYDALGMLVGNALQGKVTETVGDSLIGFTGDLDEATIVAHLADPLAAPAAILGDASSRLLYDLFAYYRTRGTAQPEPPATYTVARETHVSDLARGQPTRYQHTIAYSDGFGREIQKKTQAEPGPVQEGGPVVSPRWAGSGWTIFNNKGKPVRKYEPFFTSTHRFEFAAQAGVSTVLFYDPAGRPVVTLCPDNTWEKVIFMTWHQDSWDRNDTVLVADPRTDLDVGVYFQRLLGPAPNAFVSWHDQRISGTWGADPADRAAAQDAAQKTESHAATPSVAHLDSLARTCLAVSGNGPGGRYATRTALSPANKPLAVFDGRGGRVVEYALREPRAAGGFRYLAGYDMTNQALVRNSMDNGLRRTLPAIGGDPLRSWDALGRAFRVRYDLLRRSTHRYVTTGHGPEVLFERSIYGEGHPEDNLCTRLYRRYDMSGLASNDRYDFKGNLLQSTRQFANEYHAAPDWTPIADLTDAAALDAAGAGLLSAQDSFSAGTVYDALNRPIQVVAPHSAAMRPCVLRSSYNLAGLVETADVWLRRPAAPATLLDPATADLHAVRGMTYNARSQHTNIAYGNGVVTSYEYDPATFRLTGIHTTRPGTFPANQQVVQDLVYCYDPAGNPTRIRDDADTQNVVYFRNQRVDPSGDYSYDAVYRLIRATGREHLGQTGNALNRPQQIAESDAFREGLDHPSDGNAMARYAETYTYDSVGNLLTLAHSVSSGSWTRIYAYSEPSQIVATDPSNRLSATSLPGDSGSGPFSARYAYDAHGTMIQMPHLPVMTWDEQDRLRSTAQQVRNGGTPETTFYSYDGSGQRQRKVTDRPAPGGGTGAARRVRLYLGAVELYRELAADGTTVTLQRETLHVSAGSTLIARVETRTGGVDPGPAQMIRYQHANQLESALLELDDQARIISYEEYFPYGSTAYQAVQSQTDTPKRYRYNGKERDGETDLYYYGARYYAPWLGRWTSCDPAGIADGHNPYLYARGNPIRYWDQDGRQSTDPSPPQMNLANLGILNPAWMAQYPPTTLITEFTFLLPFQSTTDPTIGRIFGPSGMLSIRDRVGTNLEVGVYGSVGSTIPLSPPTPPPGSPFPRPTGSGSLGVSFHGGPEQPTDENRVGRGFGWWITVGQVWGQEPPTPSGSPVPPPGWSFNPTGTFMGVYSWLRPNHWGLDIAWGGGISRWGSVNGVPVGGMVTPFAGVNYSRYLSDNDVLNWEIAVGTNLGLAGRFDDVPGSGLPRSMTVNIGLFGYQHTWGDWGIGIEPWFFAEPTSNVSSPGGPSGNIGGGLRFGFGAINPRRDRPPSFDAAF